MVVRPSSGASERAATVPSRIPTCRTASSRALRIDDPPAVNHQVVRLDGPGGDRGRQRGCLPARAPGPGARGGQQQQAACAAVAATAAARAATCAHISQRRAPRSLRLQRDSQAHRGPRPAVHTPVPAARLRLHSNAVKAGLPLSGGYNRVVKAVASALHGRDADAVRALPLAERIELAFRLCDRDLETSSRHTRPRPADGRRTPRPAAPDDLPTRVHACSGSWAEPSHPRRPAILSSSHTSRHSLSNDGAERAASRLKIAVSAG